MGMAILATAETNAVDATYNYHIRRANYLKTIVKLSIIKSHQDHEEHAFIENQKVEKVLMKVIVQNLYFIII